MKVLEFDDDFFDMCFKINYEEGNQKTVEIPLRYITKKEFVDFFQRFVQNVPGDQLFKQLGFFRPLADLGSILSENPKYT